MAERYTDQILRDADSALEALESDFAGTSDDVPNDSELGQLEIEFGSAFCSDSELPRLEPGQIINLDGPAVPTVTLWFNGKPAAEGILMIQDDAIAVRITKKFGSLS